MMRSLLMLVALSALVACATGPDGKNAGAGPGAAGDAPMTPQPAGQTLVYECGEYEFVVRTGPGEVALYLPDDYRVLGQVRAASGSKYTDMDITFWSKGDTATLDLGRARYVDCQLNRERGPWEEARRRGVDFRAVGQEPGWQLEIQQERNLLLVVDYGSRRILEPTPEPELTEEGERYRTSDGRVQVEIITESCADTMSGARYTHRVSVQLDGRTYRGCGLSLEPR